MRKLLLGTFAAVALVVAGAAGAKEPQSLQLCGAGGCAMLGDEFPLPAGPAVTIAPAAAPGPYYAITFDAPENPVAYWIPGVRVLRQVDTSGIAQWVRLPDDTVAKFDAAAQSLRPFPAPTVYEVVVDHHSVPHGAGYWRLFAAGTPVRAWPRSIAWVPVRVFTTPGGPWGDGANSLWISKRGGYLMRDRQVVRISTALARRVLERRPLSS